MIEWLTDQDPVADDPPRSADHIGRTADELGHRLDADSRAGPATTAAHMTPLGPLGMIFIPSPGRGAATCRRNGPTWPTSRSAYTPWPPHPAPPGPVRHGLPRHELTPQVRGCATGPGSHTGPRTWHTALRTRQHEF